MCAHEYYVVALVCNRGLQIVTPGLSPFRDDPQNTILWAVKKKKKKKKKKKTGLVSAVSMHAHRSAV